MRTIIMATSLALAACGTVGAVDGEEPNLPEAGIVDAYMPPEHDATEVPDAIDPPDPPDTSEWQWLPGPPPPCGVPCPKVLPR